MNLYTEKFSNAKEQYLSNLRQTGASPRTLRNYERSIRLFFDSWSAKDPQGDPLPSDVRQWRDSLVEKGLSASTIKNYLADLSLFFKAVSDPELDEERIYRRNPVAKRFYPKIESRPYDIILTDSQVSRLWRMERSENEKMKYFPRNYAIVVLLLTSKIRNSELLSLRLSDINFETKELTVERGKGGKFRRVPLQPIAESAILLYLKSGIRPADVPDDSFLFGTTSESVFGSRDRSAEWHRGSSQWLSGVVERYVYNAVGVHNVRTHDLRHIGSRLELNCGASMELLQAELGHSSIVTTQIYTGRLEPRSDRAAAASAIKERDFQARRNFAALGVKTC